MWQTTTFAAAQRAFDALMPPDDDYDYEDEDEREATSYKVVTARKPRHVGTAWEIRKGDTVHVVSSFTYLKNGPRIVYAPRSYVRVKKGPAWGEVTT